MTGNQKSEPVKLAVTGSRDYQFMPSVDESLKNAVEYFDGNVIVVVGDDRGIQRRARKKAEEMGLEIIVIEANREEYGVLAQKLRDRRIVTIADKVLVFWNGEDDDTRDVIKECFMEKDPDDFNIHVENEDIVDLLYDIDDEVDHVSYVAIEDWIQSHHDSDNSNDDDSDDEPLAA